MASPLTLRLDEKTRKRIARIARRKQLSTSDAVREAIEAWVNRHEPLSSPYEVGKDLLADQPRAQESLWEMVERGALQLLALDSDDAPRIRELMHKYANRPMDLADAALLRAAEREGIRKIFTVDRRDFSVYRLHGRVRPTLLP